MTLLLTRNRPKSRFPKTEVAFSAAPLFALPVAFGRNFQLLAGKVTPKIGSQKVWPSKKTKKKSTFTIVRFQGPLGTTRDD